MYLRDGTIILVEVVGLTVAFGIAIDNAVHVLNFYSQEKGRDVAARVTLERALAEVAPALVASTFIICTSVLVTFTSDLPSLPIIGKLVIATLFVALFTNLVVLPSYIVSIERISGFLKT